jgi:hypothetical protein
MLTDDELMLGVKPWANLTEDEQNRVRVINLERARERGRQEGIAVAVGWVLILGVAYALLTTSGPYGIWYAVGWLLLAVASKRFARR